MRKVGQVESISSAKLFGDYLKSEGIENQVDELSEGVWAIWVHRDSQMEQAKEFFKLFVNDPKGARFKEGQRKTLHQQRASEALAKKLEKRRKKYEEASKTSRNSVGLFTAAVLIITVGVAIWTGLGMTEWSDSRMQPLQISIYVGTSLPEVFAGQVWRLITPVFLHFNFLHIGFNLMASLKSTLVLF